MQQDQAAKICRTSVAQHRHMEKRKITVRTTAYGILDDGRKPNGEFCTNASAMCPRDALGVPLDKILRQALA